MLLTTIFPSIRFCLTVEFPPYITMVWYLCLVKRGNYPGFVAVLVRLRHIKNGKIGDTRIPAANSSKLFWLEDLLNPSSFRFL